jgi:hypothetical protein
VTQVINPNSDNEEIPEDDDLDPRPVMQRQTRERKLINGILNQTRVRLQRIDIPNLQGTE